MGTERDLKAIEERRLKGARLLKQGLSEAEVARRLGVSRQTTNTWAQALRQVRGEVGKLKAKLLGRPRRLNAKQIERLRKTLLRGALEAGFPTELWTIARVRAVVKREFGVTYGPTGGWQLVRSMGFTPQKPERRALQRDEAAIAHWKRRTWPALKKTPRARGARSSS